MIHVFYHLKVKIIQINNGKLKRIHLIVNLVLYGLKKIGY